MQLSNLLLNFMTKSFLFPEIDSERAVPAPNENGLRRPALRRGFGKASVFLPAGRQVSGLFCGFRAVRPCRLLFLRGSGACAGGENRTHDSTLEVSNFATKLRPHKFEAYHRNRTRENILALTVTSKSPRELESIPKQPYIPFIMHGIVRLLLSLIGIAGAVAFIVLLFEPSERATSLLNASYPGTTTPAEITPASSTPSVASTDTEEKKIVSPDEEHKTVVASPVLPSPKTPEETEPAEEGITRIQDPYPFPPFSFELVNTEARAALVNILCSTTGGGSLLPTTASGVLIDPRGVILTNAHVAQYVLLSQSARTNLSCVIRYGSPAKALWNAEILYIPPVWIQEHAEDIGKEHATGTGEHDYALLRITGMLDGTPLLPLSALVPDTREKIAFLGDPILTASYPAEFSGASAQSGLFPSSSITTVQELLTFGSGSVDVISVGGIAAAQSGSSGGSVVNAWNRLVGIITTTSAGATTAERDLRAITLSYINRDIAAQSGSDIASFLAGDIVAKAVDFNAREAPALVQLLIDNL